MSAMISIYCPEVFSDRFPDEVATRNKRQILQNYLNVGIINAIESHQKHGVFSLTFLTLQIAISSRTMDDVSIRMRYN